VAVLPVARPDDDRGVSVGLFAFQGGFEGAVIPVAALGWTPVSLLWTFVNVPEHVFRWSGLDGQARYHRYIQRPEENGRRRRFAFIDVTAGSADQFFRDAEYSDYHHMSPEGAGRFTAMLAARSPRRSKQSRPAQEQNRQTSRRGLRAWRLDCTAARQWDRNDHKTADPCSCTDIRRHLGSAYDVATRQEHWPFSDYPMFSAIHRTTVLEWPRLFGVAADGSEVALVDYDYLWPLDQSRLPIGLRHIYRTERDLPRVHAALEDCLAGMSGGGSPDITTGRRCAASACIWSRGTSNPTRATSINQRRES
jgi:hypothetical protein